MTLRYMTLAAVAMLLMVSLASYATARGLENSLFYVGCPDPPVLKPKPRWCSSYKTIAQSLDGNSVSRDAPVWRFNNIYNIDSLFEKGRCGKPGLPNQHREIITAFLVTVGSFLRDEWKHRNSMWFLGTEKNPTALIVLLAIVDNLENAPSWTLGVHSTVMCYLRAIADQHNKGAPAALASAINQCEFPQIRRPSALDYRRTKSQIVNYCGSLPPFREAE